MSIGDEVEKLKKRRDRLVQEILKLDEAYKRGELDEEEYRSKRKSLEREVVEVMDRLVQYESLMKGLW